MKGELKGFEYKPKKKGDRVYSGAYGNGTVLSVDSKIGRQKHLFVDGKRISVPDPMLIIQFDQYPDPIEKFDSDVGELEKEGEK